VTQCLNADGYVSTIHDAIRERKPITGHAPDFAIHGKRLVLHVAPPYRLAFEGEKGFLINIGVRTFGELEIERVFLESEVGVVYTGRDTAIKGANRLPVVRGVFFKNGRPSGPLGWICSKREVEIGFFTEATLACLCNFNPAKGRNTLPGARDSGGSDEVASTPRFSRLVGTR
jgi:hypothetical protein